MNSSDELHVAAVVKLLDYVASGIGSVAGPMLATWRARREAQAIRIAAKGEADALLIQAEAQSEAREILLSQDTEISGELDISDAVRQRIQFQERKRQLNIESVVKKAATQLGDTEVSNDETDHDWTAHFFNHVQDVSSEEMQSLWAKVLAGEVERAGSTSIRTLGILKNIDQSTARLFRKFCSGCVFLCIDGRSLTDARVPSLGGNAASNVLKPYGLGFGELNRLNEHGIIISDYNSWYDYRMSVGQKIDNPPGLIKIPFCFQGRYWILDAANEHDVGKEFRLSGVALTNSGRELSRVVSLESLDNFAQALVTYFQNKNWKMTEVASHDPLHFRITL